MKYFLIALLLLTTYAYAQNNLKSVGVVQPDIEVIDNSQFTITPAEPVPVSYNVNDLQSEIQSLKQRDQVWTDRIAADQVTIDNDQALIDQGAQAGTQDALQYASPAIKQQLGVATQVNAVTP